MAGGAGHAAGPGGPGEGLVHQRGGKQFGGGRCIVLMYVVMLAGLGFAVVLEVGVARPAGWPAGWGSDICRNPYEYNPIPRSIIRSTELYEVIIFS